MPAVPFIPAIGSAIWGGISARRNAKRAGQADKAQQAALAALMAAGRQQQGAGTELYDMGSPWLRQTGTYFSTLLGGDRAAQRMATAAPTARITELYRGAERGMERQGIRGGVRETAMAELNRDRAAQIASQITGVQPMAAASLGNLAGSTVGAGLGALGDATRSYGAGAGAYGQRRESYTEDQRSDMGGMFRSLGDLVGVWNRTRKPGGKLGGTDPWSSAPTDFTYGMNYPLGAGQ